MSMFLLWKRDHPRVCGEHFKPTTSGTEAPGSSPRMRGTQIIGARAKSASGIIPAYAGNTFRLSRLGGRLRDHPRVCGEHRSRTGNIPDGTGSSPRMRGTQHRWQDRLAARGIIPAYAGNTSVGTSLTVNSGDHPRVCGEHGGRIDVNSLYPGSSPRMRGTHGRRRRAAQRRGIIPAYAGNTPCRSSGT